MNLETNQLEIIRQYLLGLAPEEELSKLDERVVTDGEFYQELLIIESELIDEYLSGELSEAERAGFESHFLVSPERQKQLRFAKSFHSYLNEKAPERDLEPSVDEAVDRPTVVPKPPPRPWYSSFLPIRSPALAYATMAALLVLIVGISWWLLRSRAPESGTIYAVTLSARPTRGVEAAETKFRIPAGTGLVQLRVPLPPDEYPAYRVVLLSSDNSELWRGSNVKGTVEAGTHFLTANVPARLLPPGTYKLKVSGVLADGKIEDLPGYQFTVIL